MMGLIRLAVLALVILLLALFVLRPLLRPARISGESAPMSLPSGAGMATAGAGAADTMPVGMFQPVALSGEIAEAAGGGTSGESDMFSPSSMLAGQETDPVERMRALIAGRQDDTLQILRGWMDERREGR